MDSGGRGKKNRLLRRLNVIHARGGGALGVRHARFTIHSDLVQTGSDAWRLAFYFIQRNVYRVYNIMHLRV